MNKRNKLNYGSLLFSSLLFVFVSHSFAATTTVATTPQPKEEQAVLIADVNFKRIATTTKDGVLDVSFGISSSFGNQSNVTYGIIVRGKKSGELLDSMTAAEKLELQEKNTVNKSLQYPLPKYLNEDAIIYLASYNERGITLAVENIGQIKKGTAKAFCKQTKEDVTCTSQQQATLTVTISEVTPQGAIVSTITNPITTTSPVTTTINTITEKLPPGQYVLSFSTTNEAGVVLGKYMTEYVKEGEYTRILSIAPKDKGNSTLEVTVFAMAFNLATSTHLTLLADTGSCGKSPSVPFGGKVVTLLFNVSCPTGELIVYLKNGNTTIDSMKGTFSVSGGQSKSSQTPPSESHGNRSILYVLLALFILLLVGVGIWKIKSKKGVVTAIVCLFFSITLLYSGDKVHAATYVIGGYEDFVYQVGLTTDTMYGYNITGTVTVSNSVTAGNSYTGTVTQVLSDSSNMLCKDSSADTTTCDSLDVDTQLYHNKDMNAIKSGVSSNDYLPPHISSKSFTFTASGVDYIWFVQNVAAQLSVECNQTYGGRKCLKYPDIYSKINIVSTCDWQTTGYKPNWGYGHNSVKCTTPKPSDGTPKDSYCDSSSEDGDITECCDTGADCYQYTCDYAPALCPKPASVEVYFSD